HFKRSDGGVTNLGGAWTRAYPKIAETEQTITVKTAGLRIELSNGDSVTYVGNQVIDRIQYSFGVGGVTQLDPGWAYVYAIENSGMPGQGAIELQMSGALAPLAPHRYLGAVRLLENTSCVADECTDGASLPATCQDYSVPGSCPSNFGRLVGVVIEKCDHRYHYEFPLLYTASAGSYVALQDLPPNAVRIVVSANNLAFKTFEPEELSGIFMNGLTWIRMSGPGIQVFDSGSLSSTVWLGHEEDERLYE
ncbi:MAG: hypothetical protein IT285_13835, partial [Bdellovibrionales bacterium]|nr:hypothetical protein [Bdellovibrionales bacterium]